MQQTHKYSIKVLKLTAQNISNNNHFKASSYKIFLDTNGKILFNIDDNKHSLLSFLSTLMDSIID